MTDRVYYHSLLPKHSNAVIIMRYYESYEIRTSHQCDIAAPVVCPLLTHKYAGKCYQLGDDYGEMRLSFGRHNLQPVTCALVRAGYRVVIVDYNEFIKDHPQPVAHFPKPKPKPRQLSLFDIEGFLD